MYIRAKFFTMKNIPLVISVVALLAAGAGFFLNNQAAKQNELKVLAVEKELKDYIQSHGGTPPPIDPAATENPATPPPLTIPITGISFAKNEHNFGTITQGEKVKTKFTFTNSGTENLVITNATGSCGCTVPEYPKEPIAPGKSGEILVEFNSEGKEGEQSKTVTVEANTEPRQTVLTIKSNIVKK
jgi:type II secretory pathway pseudopilin PulG